MLEEYGAKRAVLSRSKESGEKNSAEEFLFISSQKAVRRGRFRTLRKKEERKAFLLLSRAKASRWERRDVKRSFCRQE